MMMNSTKLSIGILVFLILFSTGCGDKVRPTNKSGGIMGILVDGSDGTNQINDRSRVFNADITDVGSLEASSISNDIIAFAESRAVSIRENANWTTGDDEENIGLSNQINIPITVWIVKGPESTRRTKAINACINTVGIFQSERVGIGFSQFEIIDKTGVPSVSNFYHFPSSSDPQDWKDNIGWKNDRINIYYLETVSGSTTTGRAVNFTNFIVLGENFGDIAVVHEVGHSLSARHKSSPDFNTDCVMWPFYTVSDPAEFFSEGELFRMHLNSTSALNNVYTSRSGQPVRSCVGDVSNDQCVDWKKRLWDDGTLLSN